MKNITAGFTLVELLIALVISMFILASVTEVYLFYQQSFRAQQALAQLQEVARSTMQLLAADIRSAGFIGCARLTSDFPIQNHTGYEFNSANKLFASHGNGGSWSPALPDTLISSRP